MLNDPASETWRRRLAAWNLPEPGDLAIESLLGEGPAEPSGHVYAAALVAERHLPRTAAVALAESWIRDLDDDRKRAGALLAALLGAHRALLRRAFDLEDTARVKLTQRLALFALGETPEPGDPLVLGHRALAARGSDFDPDAAVCLLLAGDRSVLEHLTRQPARAAGYGEAVQQRAWLIERFVPGWHREAGRLIAGDARSVGLHLDGLEALRLLTQRGLAFDPQTKTFAAAGGG